MANKNRTNITSAQSRQINTLLEEYEDHHDVTIENSILPRNDTYKALVTLCIYEHGASSELETARKLITYLKELNIL